MYDDPSRYNKRIKPRIDLTLGYIYFMDKNHPLASNTGRVWLHRHVVSVQIGRWLSPTEVVHHIDGDKSNNNIENLRIFKNVSEHSKHHQNDIPQIECKQCGKLFQPEQNGTRTYCSIKCSRKSTRKTNITKEELQKLVWEKPLVKIAEQFNVSDKAVSKWCQKFGIPKPPRGYWLKAPVV